MSELGQSLPKCDVRAMSGLPPKATEQRTSWEVSNVPILLQKSFWGDDQNFSGPLMRFARGDMRDHIVSHKTNHGASCWRYGILRFRSRLKINICETFGVVRFSTFATISANSSATFEGCLDRPKPQRDPRFNLTGQGYFAVRLARIGAGAQKWAV
jgi:hypothetical protein